MAREYRIYWKCEKCHGTGQIIISGSIIDCVDCDATGNRWLDEIRWRREAAGIHTPDLRNTTWLVPVAVRYV